MNKNLQKISDFIEKAENLSSEEKTSLAKAIKDVDSTLTITEFKLDRTEKIKRTNSILLEETIEELEKKRIAVEQQNRELEIESSLERVRARAMAMQKSGELAELVDTVFKELTKLHFLLDRCIIMIYDPETNGSVWWMANPEPGSVPVGLFVKYHTHKPYLEYVRAWRARTIKWEYLLKGKSKKEWDKYIFKETDLSHLPHFVIDGMRSVDQVFLNASFNNFGSITASTVSPLPEEQFDILLRFAKVFDMTYTRFHDLKQAEAQVREAIKASSLDRVRAEIASMRSVDDLKRITPLIWHELKALGVPFVRCGVFIVQEETAHVQVFLSAPDGRSLASLEMPFNSSELTKNSVINWRKGLIFKTHWDKDEFMKWMQSLVSEGQVQNAETYQGASNPPESLDLHLVPFVQGMLYVGNIEPLSVDELTMVKSLAEAFSIAYARYEDFKKLEIAKKSIETTLSELKAAQSQLIQSEKMASLGELTAGIAHEIQNPLNFVNNFSEVNAELIAEMKEEIKKGNLDEVTALANDIADNEQKINHHGKRADAIVKGMLQHSRSSTGVKEPTNINTLTDEYLRLAYHGLRAKDKSFNATLKTDFDESIGKIDIIPQDIGRVILNLITNAFYAVDEKKKLLKNDLTGFENLSGLEEYQPTVLVGTKKMGEKVLISVKDNGNGIPPKDLDKIFQPFFTTKPTGQGTGLGLSMSYDIITKGHGGELQVENKEGEGAEFKIILPLKI